MIFYSWYDQSDKPTTTEKEAEAESSVKQYYAFVLNGVGKHDYLISNFWI